MSRYLTVEEVAEALGVSASWVYKHKDLLGGVRLGKRLWRFPEQELTTLLAQPARGSPPSVSEGAAAQCSGFHANSLSRHRSTPSKHL
jgi:excisionase family DNA binding protein